MSLALAELIIEDVAWDKQTTADKFVACFKRDPRPGYARSFFDFLQEIESGAEFLEQMRPRSVTNGVAMRAAPLGVIKDLNKLLDIAELQASLTHNTEIGIKSAQAVPYWRIILFIIWVIKGV